MRRLRLPTPRPRRERERRAWPDWARQFRALLPSLMGTFMLTTYSGGADEARPDSRASRRAALDRPRASASLQLRWHQP
jgi:hypothetical protein